MTTASDNNDTISDASDDVDESFLENGTGFYPFSQVPVWITLNASPSAVLVYVFLKTYTGQTTRSAFPSRETIAAGALKTKQARSVDRYISELEHIGAIAKKQRRSSGNLKIKNIYRLEWSPPADFTGPITRQDWEAMGCPVAETVPIFTGASKKPAYTVVRFSALRDEQEKHSEDSEKTQNPRSPRSAPERTSMCAKTHPGSAQKRTGTRSKPPISKSNPNPPPTPHAPVTETAPSPTEGGEDSDDTTKPEPDALTDAVALVKSTVSTTEMDTIVRHRRRIELAELVSWLLASGCARAAIVDVLSRDRSGLGDIVSGLIARLRGLEPERGSNPQDDPFASHKETDRPQSGTPAHCGTCWHGPRCDPRWRRVIVSVGSGVDDDEVGDICTCHPDHPHNHSNLESHAVVTS